jgi:undecaprenyl-diphosphatase
LITDPVRVSTVIVLVAKYAVFLIPLGALLAWWRASRQDKAAMIIAGVVALALAAIAINVSAAVWFDPRPFAVDGHPPLFAHAPDNGFPSDHTTLGVAIGATLFGWRRRLGASLVLVALTAGAARVAAHVHHVPDIIGGLVLGILCALGGVLVAKRSVVWMDSRRRASILSRARLRGEEH